MPSGVPHWVIIAVIVAVLAAVAIIATAMVAKAWISLLKTKLLEKARNERLDRILKDTTPDQRRPILEVYPDGKKSDEDQPNSTDGHPVGILERWSIFGWLTRLWRYLWNPNDGL